MSHSRGIFASSSFYPVMGLLFTTCRTPHRIASFTGIQPPMHCPAPFQTAEMSKLDKLQNTRLNLRYIFFNEITFHDHKTANIESLHQTDSTMPPQKCKMASCYESNTSSRRMPPSCGNPRFSHHERTSPHGHVATRTVQKRPAFRFHRDRLLFYSVH